VAKRKTVGLTVAGPSGFTCATMKYIDIAVVAPPPVWIEIPHKR